MALPKLTRAGIDQASPQEVSKTPMNVELEVKKLFESIKKSSSEGLKAATQSVVGNVPSLIRDLTDDIKSGSINNFATAMNKLISLTEDLGINLRQYNEELADTVERFTGNQAKMQEELQKLREQGIRAEIDGETNRLKILTQNDILEYNKEKQVNEESIKTNREQIEQRLKLLNLTDEELKLKGENRKDLETEIKSRADANKKLEETNQKIDEKTGTTADTGRGGDQGFGKFQELKEAFMVIPDTITESFGQVKQVATTLFAGVMKFVRAPLQTIGKLFKSIANVFKSARALIALKVIAVIAAFQFFAEKIEAVGDFFVGVWEKNSRFLSRYC